MSRIEGEGYLSGVSKKVKIRSPASDKVVRRENIFTGKFPAPEFLRVLRPPQRSLRFKILLSHRAPGISCRILGSQSARRSK
jgi:hypothetical protein